MSDWGFAFSISYSRDPWTEGDKVMPFFRVFRGTETADRYVKLWRFVLTFIVQEECF